MGITHPEAGTVSLAQLGPCPRPKTPAGFIGVADLGGVFVSLVSLSVSRHSPGAGEGGRGGLG